MVPGSKKKSKKKVSNWTPAIIRIVAFTIYGTLDIYYTKVDTKITKIAVNKYLPMKDITKYCQKLHSFLLKLKKYEWPTWQ